MSENVTPTSRFLEGSRTGLQRNNSFGSGRLNETGLHLEFKPDSEAGGVCARFTPTPNLEGYLGMVHGGIICTMLDEAMTWAVFQEDIVAMTGELSVRFRRPVALGEALVIRGQIGDRRGRVLSVSGAIYRESDGKLLAESGASFVMASAGQASRLKDRYLGTQDYGIHLEPTGR